MGLNIKYNFKDNKLLSLALLHPSAFKKGKAIRACEYERLEFLGDKILGAIIAKKLYNKFSEYSEGQMSVMHANLVNTNTLAKIAEKINLKEYMILNISEEQSGGRDNPKNLANCLEALIAAIYIDSNFDTVEDEINHLWEEFFANINLDKKDDKTLLQEYVQKKYTKLPIYKIESVSGLAHDPIFVISVSVKKEKMMGIGKTKKIATQKAASAMIKYLKNQKEINNG